MPVPFRRETESLIEEGPNFYIDRDFLTLEEAAFDVQSHLQLVASGVSGAASLADKWILSRDRLGKRLRFIISATEIYPATDHDEEMKIRIANRGLSFCSRHGIIQSTKEFKETPHLLESFHESGDYTVRPDGNLPGIDQILIRTIGYDLHPKYRGKDTVRITSFRGLEEPDIQGKIVRKILALHKAAGTSGSLAESIALALAKRESSVDFANAFGARIAELAMKEQAIRAGIDPKITEVVFNFRKPEDGGVSYCCKP